MKKTEKNISSIKEKKEILEILERFESILGDEYKDVAMIYKVVGKEEEQATNWKTGELLWEDEEKTIPKYRDRYDYVDRTEDEITDVEYAKASAIEKVRKHLEQLI